MQQEPEHATPLTPPMEQQPTIKEEVSITPPPFVDDPKKVKRKEWIIDKYIPNPINGDWAYASNLNRAVKGYFDSEPSKEQVNQLLFIDYYEDAAALYIKRAQDKRGT